MIDWPLEVRAKRSKSCYCCGSAVPSVPVASLADFPWLGWDLSLLCSLHEVELAAELLRRDAR